MRQAFADFAAYVRFQLRTRNMSAADIVRTYGNHAGTPYRVPILTLEEYEAKYLDPVQKLRDEDPTRLTRYAPEPLDSMAECRGGSWCVGC